jgi:hypothetical protein
LQKSLIFAPKPVLYLRFDDVAKAVFLRVTGGSKLFDLELKRKNGAQSIMLNSIEKAELGSLKEYFQSKNVQVEVDDEQKKV